MLKKPEGVVREVLSGNDRGYDLRERTAKELEMRIGWTKINNKVEVEEEVLNGQFVVPYPYVKEVDVVVRPHLRKELLQPTEVVGFGYESDGRDSEAKEFGTESEAGTVEEPDEEGFQPARTRWEKLQAKFEKRVLNDYIHQMQT